MLSLRKFADQSWIFIVLQFINVFGVTPICIKVCSCRNNTPSIGLQTVDCSRSYLSVVPQVNSWPKNVSLLDLSANNISALDFEMTHGKLSVLKLHYNKISKVVPSAFGGLNNLKYLDLSNNIISELDGNAFYGLEGLLVLNISNNKFKELPDNIFYNLFDLEVLSIAGNPIVHVDPVHFNRNLNLKSLNMANIGAYTFSPKQFYALDNLRYLDISTNDFHSVPTEALRSAKNLRWLKLNENPIDKLDKKSFIRMQTLEVLQISYMDQLELIDSQTFGELIKLKKLEIKYNKNLRTIASDAFDGILGNNSKPVLEELDLEKNQLTVLEKFPCAKIRKFNLQKNPWICDCRMKWIKRCEIPPIYAADLRCYNPRKFRNNLIIQMPEEDFKCEYQSGTSYPDSHHDRLMRTMSLVIGTTLLLCLAGFILLIIKWKSIRNWWTLKRRGPGAVYYVRAQANPLST